ncbi:MAG: hypothetical protein SGILL_010211, partial [Bacillariaceae sp.]
LLMSALDSGPEVSIYPFAQFMKRDFAPEAASDTSSQCSAQEALFFIGLRFAADVESLNLKQYSSEFLYGHLNSWEGRKPGMDFMMAHMVQEDLPLDLIEQHVNIKSPSSPQGFSSPFSDDESSSEFVKTSSFGAASDDGSDEDSCAMMPQFKRQRSGTIDKT